MYRRKLISVKKVRRKDSLRDVWISGFVDNEQNVSILRFFLFPEKLT